MQFLADISQEVTKTLVNYNAHEELFHILEAYKDDDSKHGLFELIIPCLIEWSELAGHTHPHIGLM